MQFGLYAPIPMATVGSPEIAQSVAESLRPLPAARRDRQFDHGLELLLAADTAGFDLCLFAERHLGSDLSAWVMASAIASRFEHIRALVAVHPGLFDPAMTAKLAASLDRICKGRVALNIVNGSLDENFGMFGGTLLEGEARYRRTAEFIAILRGLWTHETFSFSGDHYNVSEGRLLLKPASPTPPELYSVSPGDRGRDVIAQHCDWWFVSYPKTAETTAEVLHGIEDSIEDMNRLAGRYGRKVRYAINPFVALGSSGDAALEVVIERIFAYDPDADTRKIRRRMLPATKLGCIGSPDQVRAQLGRFEELGIELVLCKMIPTMTNMQSIVREVIAPLRAGDLLRAAS